MTLSSLGRASAIGVAILLSTGCGSMQSQSPVPQTPSVSRQAREHLSWMSAKASASNLLYATFGCGGTCVISYPDGKLVGTLYDAGDGPPCADQSGNVYIPQQSQLLEYAHAGTTPVATFTAGGFIGGCSVDPTTGNVAVTYDNAGPTVAVFAPGTSNPVTYSVSQSRYCGYDNAGNLFVDAFDSSGLTALYELASGQSTFEQLSLSQSINGFPSQVQWDGKYLSLERQGAPSVSLYRLAISGSKATVVKRIRIRGSRYGSFSWIYGNTVFIPFAKQGRKVTLIGAWKYPKSGKPEDTISHLDKRASLQGVTYSPSQ